MSKCDKMILTDIPPSLRRAFKAACGKNGKFMNHVVRAFMRKYAAKAGFRTESLG